MTEMTVYRYFPDRSQLLKALWDKINEILGKDIGMPESANTLLDQNAKLIMGFDKNPAIAIASITTPQGREMRTAINELRRKSFLKITKELNPKLNQSAATRIGAILQLLHSAYAWDCLKQHWNLSGSEIAQATADAITILMNSTKKGKSL